MRRPLSARASASTPPPTPEPTMTMSNLVPVPSYWRISRCWAGESAATKPSVHLRLKTHRMKPFYIFASKTHGTNPKSNVCDSCPECRGSSFMMLITFMSGRW